MGALVSSAINMQLSNSNTGSGGIACLWPQAQTLEMIKLNYALPAIVALILAIGYAVQNGSEWFRSLLAIASGARGRRSRAASEQLSEATPARSYTARERYIASVPKASTLLYSALTMTTFQLLQCVPVEARQVLYVSAVHECGPWQIPLYLITFLLSVPVLFGLAGALPCGHGIHRDIRRRFHTVIRESLRAPYRKGSWYWEAVLASHRLAVAAIYSTFTNSAVASILGALVCCVAYGCHSYANPVRERSGNLAQTLLLSNLVLLAFLCVPQALLDTNALAESDSVTELVSHLKVAKIALLLLPGVVVGGALLKLAWQKRSALLCGHFSSTTLACDFSAEDSAMKRKLAGRADPQGADAGGQKGADEAALFTPLL